MEFTEEYFDRYFTRLEPGERKEGRYAISRLEDPSGFIVYVANIGEKPIWLTNILLDDSSSRCCICVLSMYSGQKFRWSFNNSSTTYDVDIEYRSDFGTYIAIDSHSYGETNEFNTNNGVYSQTRIIEILNAGGVQAIPVQFKGLSASFDITVYPT